MRPFWRWTGWLSLSLAGCLHGPNGHRVQTSSTSGRHDTSRSVTPVSAKRAYARLLPTAPANQVTTNGTAPQVAQTSGEATYRVPIPTPAGTAVTSNEACETCLQEECARPRSERGSRVEYLPPPIPPVDVTAEDLPPEISIVPQSPVVTKKQLEPKPFNAVGRAVPISPAVKSRTIREPELADEFFPEDAVRQIPAIVRNVSSQNETDLSAIPSKESSDVTTAAPSEPIFVNNAQPNDVAVLVQQVFEDLRQRRLTDAKQRTEWLKQLVAKRSVSPKSTQPQSLESNQTAAVTEPLEPENFFDETESNNE